MCETASTLHSQGHSNRLRLLNPYPCEVSTQVVQILPLAKLTLLTFSKGGSFSLQLLSENFAFYMLSLSRGDMDVAHGVWVCGGTDIPHLT